MSGFYFSNNYSSPEDFKARCEFLKSRGSHLSTKVLKGAVIGYSSHSESKIPASYNKCHVILDGQVYNFDSLNKDFEAKDQPELLAKMYRKYGEKMLSFINGSFSFVIYDTAKSVVFGARDRLGEKPFFYAQSADKIECSSCLRAVAYQKKFGVNENARRMYAHFGFIYDSECILDGINKLPAGHYFTFDLKTNKFKVEQYWEISDSYNQYPKFDKIEDTVSFIHFLLKDSIELRFPFFGVGMGISSGTDSFAIFSILKKDLEKDPYLLNLVSKHDELEKTISHVKAVDPNKRVNGVVPSRMDYLRGIENYHLYYDEPNADLSCINTDVLFRIIKAAGYSTAFSGVGGDDVFFGKPNYIPYLKSCAQYRLSCSDLRTAFYKKQVEDPFEKLLIPNDQMSMQRYDTKTFLQNLLVKEDIASSHNGIEVRNPFCDYRLVEFANTLSINDQFKNNQLKFLLKTLLLNKTGADFFKEKKIGFGPGTKAISLSLDTEQVLAVLSPSNIERYFPELQYRHIFKLISDRGTDEVVVWNLYLFIKIMESYRQNICK